VAIGLGIALIGLGWQLTRDRRSSGPASAAEALPAATAQRELFIVAEFTHPPENSTWAPVIAQAIRDELAASPRLVSVSEERVAAAKSRMRLAPGAPLTAGVARELAVREEIRMVVEGGYRPMGSGLALAVRIIEAATGDVIHAVTATARDSTEITDAIERLARGLRSGLGEPLAPIQVPTGSLWSYTTSSLPALEKHQLAIQSRAAGDYLRAVELGREAVVLDPGFAMAYTAIASNMAFAGLPTGQMAPGLLRAFELADSVSEGERYAVAGFYHLYVTGDLTKSVAAFLGHIDALKALPGEAGFVVEASTALQLNGDAGAAERMVAEVKSAMEQHGARWPAGRSSGGVQLAHVQVLHALGREAEAGRILAEVSRRRPENTRVLHFRIGFLADSGRYEDAHALAAQLRRQSGLRNGLRVQAELDAVRGRVGEAIGHLADLRDQALTLGQIGAAIEITAAMAKLRMLSGDSIGASEVDDLLVRHQVDSLDVFSRPYLPLALFYAEAGQVRQARAWLRRYQREFPSELRGPDGWMLHRIRAAVAAAGGDPTRSLTELRGAARAPALRVGLFDEPSLRLSDHPELARRYRQLNEPDSAIAVYRRFLAARSLTRIVADAFERGPALEALGALYEERGEHRLAAAAYDDFAQLWREADARLQPRVEAARRRVSVLRR
jgi:tetratricopeptide (TPR) repeat protein